MAAELWYNFFKQPFTGNEPAFFNIENEKWKQEIEAGYPLIEQELLNFIANNTHNLKEYRFINPGSPTWQTFAMLSWGYRHTQNLKQLPLTWQLFKGIPQVVSVSLSRLVAHKEIGKHHGDTNAIMRCHLGVIVPGTLPQCGFMVEDEARNWQQGKLFAFCDARLHWAKNETDKDRYVLIIDVMRPDFMPIKNKVCATVIATHVLYEVNKRVRFRKYLPGAVLKAITWLTALPVRLYLAWNK